MFEVKVSNSIIRNTFGVWWLRNMAKISEDLAVTPDSPAYMVHIFIYVGHLSIENLSYAHWTPLDKTMDCPRVG